MTEINHPLPYKLYIFDADHTLRRCTVDNQPCPNNPDEWELLPNVAGTIAAHYMSPVFKLAIASNQGGVEFGFLTEAMARQLLLDCAQSAFGTNYVPALVKMCPHMKCDNRKPNPGMLEDLMFQTRSHPDNTVFVGDLGTDQETAERAGCAFILASDFFAWPF